MALSAIGMVFAASGHLALVSGAIAQEIIDVLAVLNALRAAFPPREIQDTESVLTKPHPALDTAAVVRV
jgi:hypothetical protein